MCNAWNHSPDCNCGWGGEGHLGGNPTPFRVSSSSLDGFKTIESFTNPNARCPICNAQVFFYQNASGSKVYFNELGPPWEKHPCMQVEAKGITHLTPPSSQEVKTIGIQESELAKWMPVLEPKINEIGNGILKVTQGDEEKYPWRKPFYCVGGVTSGNNKHCTLPGKHLNDEFHVDFIFYRPIVNAAPIYLLDFYNTTKGSCILYASYDIQSSIKIKKALRDSFLSTSLQKQQ
ncbi:hypothetical protein OS176_13265 [Xanthomonadaceae bacterium XH05]|nr:hypothetical protein [Xanthomonadaceae bacterium XH05]